MINLLPPIKKSITNGINSTTSIHEVMWSVADSHPKHGKIPHYIESEITQDDDLFYDNNIIYFPPIILPFQEPNLKHAIIYYDTDTTGNGDYIFKSPLHSDVVGVADEPELFFQPPKLTHKTINYKDKVGESNNRCLILKVINSLPISIELFVQKNLNMINTTVLSNAEISRLVSGMPPENGAYETTSCWLTTMKRATVLSSSRQAIKEFVFDTRKRIGLEVEIINDVLTCVSVLDDSQASRYKTELDGAEMVAVNGVRVMTLDDFGEHVRLATIQGYRISLTVVSFVDSKAKNDVLQMRSMKRKLAVTSMFSNLMRIGLDKDYHGDIHDGDNENDRDDEDDNNDRVQHEGSAEHQSVHNDKSVDKENNSHIDNGKDDDHDELSTLQTRSSIKSFRQDDNNSVDNDDDDDDDDVVNDHVNDHVNVDDDVDDDDDESGMKANRTKYLPRKEISIVPAVNRLASTSMDSDESSSLSLGGTLNNNTWAITNKEEVYDVIALVCTPQKMDKSMEWGDEKKILQITNYSTTWELELFWIDEEGSLVSRGNITPGACLFCMCGKNQLWALKAKSIKSTTASTTSKNNQPVLSLMKDNNNNNNMLDDIGIDDNISTHTDEIEYPALMIIQLTSSSLSNNKCSSIIWTPFSSMSVAHRLHVNKKSSNNSNNSNDVDDKAQSKINKAGGGHNDNFIATDTPPPHMHIQVFDRVEKGNLVGSSTKSNSNSKIDNKHRDPRQQQKQRQRQLVQQQEIKNENPYKIDKVKLTKWPKPPKRQNK